MPATSNQAADFLCCCPSLQQQFHPLIVLQVALHTFQTVSRLPRNVRWLQSLLVQPHDFFLVGRAAALVHAVAFQGQQLAGLLLAKYAEKHLFNEIEEIGVRDGANLEVRGYEFAPNFSIWTIIEECLNPPVIWEKERGWFTTEPFSESGVFEFPEGIGPAECVNVEHEEVLLVPRWVKCKRVTFKYGLGD